MSLRVAIDEAQYLYVEMVHEDGGLTLSIVVHEAYSGGGTKHLPGLGDMKATAIVADETTPKYLVQFASYVAYSVRDESYVSRDEAETWTGRFFRVYTHSKFLDYVEAATLASDDYPGPLTHYELVTLNHIVDVVSIEEPEVKLIDHDQDV